MKPESLFEQITPDQEQERNIRQCVLDFLHVLLAFGVFVGALHLDKLR